MKNKPNKGGRKPIHGDSPRNSKRAPEYYAWDHMKARCLRPNSANYHRYGGRGIKICKRWMKYENFLADMGRRPSPKHSLDRIRVNGNYTPKNCRWATAIEQCNNTTRNVILKYNGKKYTMAELARAYSIDYKLVLGRIKRGWSVEKTVATPKILTFKRKLAA